MIQSNGKLRRMIGSLQRPHVQTPPNGVDTRAIAAHSRRTNMAAIEGIVAEFREKLVEAVEAEQYYHVEAVVDVNPNGIHIYHVHGGRRVRVN